MSISSLSCKLQPAVRGVISLDGVFLGVLGIIALPEMANCLFRSHLLDAVGGATESVSTLSQEEHTHVIDLVLLLLYVTMLVCGWM